jgi:uncharacterized protein (DUF58 family)
VNRYASSQFYLLLSAAAIALLASVVTRRPELAAAAAPLLALLVVGVAGHRWADVRVEVRPAQTRVVEGDEFDLLVEVRASQAVPWLDLELVLPSSLRSRDGSSRAIVALPGGAGARVVHFPVEAVRWGVCSPEHLLVAARDRFGLFSRSWIVSIQGAVRIYPREAYLRGLVAPRRTGHSLGAHLATARGEGCEFADVRPFRPGDRPRAVNWRVTARRGERWVTERHPERSADLVLLLDAGTDIGEGDDTTLRRSIRAAMSMADGHVAVHDRVGLCSLGGTLRWLTPRLGQYQLYRVVDALLDSQEAARSGRGGSGVAGSLASLGPGGGLPVRGLAPGSAVVALTPLLDPRVVSVIADLRQRGFDTVVVEVSAEAVLPAPDSEASWLARRVWRLEREAVRRQLSAVGVPCVAWDDSRPLGAALDLVARRRSGRMVRT